MSPRIILPSTPEITHISSQSTVKGTLQFELWKKALLCLSVFIALTGCAFPTGNQGAALSCDEIVQPHERALHTTTMTRVEMRGWVEEHYQVLEEAILMTDYSPEEGTIFTESWLWDYEGKTYVVYFIGDEVKRLNIDWDSDRPTVGTVLNCFGAPEFYRAGLRPGPHGDDQLDLMFWYPSQGMVLGHVQFGGFLRSPETPEKPVLNDNALVEYADIINQDDIGAVVMSSYFGFSKSDPQNVFAGLKTWPGGWDQIVTEQVWPEHVD